MSSNKGTFKVSIHKHQFGFTLIELLVVLSVTGVLMLLTVAWIHETMNFSSRIENHRRQHTQLNRLSWELRADVRMSQTMAIEDDIRLVLKQRDGHQIVYEISGTTIKVRKVFGSQVRREKYTLATNSLIQWDTSGLPESIGLVVTRFHGSPSKSSSNLVDDADQKSHPIDIHIFAQINRRPVGYAVDNIERGAQ